MRCGEERAAGGGAAGSGIGGIIAMIGGMVTIIGRMVTMMGGMMTMIGGMVTMTAITRVLQIPSVMVARRFRYIHISKLELMITLFIQIPKVMMKSVWQSEMKVTSTHVAFNKIKITSNHVAFNGRPLQRF